MLTMTKQSAQYAVYHLSRRMVVTSSLVCVDILCGEYSPSLTAPHPPIDCIDINHTQLHLPR